MSMIALLIYFILTKFTDTGSELIPEHHYVIKRPFGKINGTTGQSFLELIQGDFYMDKTYILKEILKRHKFKTLVITLPSKWGKSLNLDMMKVFLEIPVDSRGKRIIPRERSSNYRLFHRNQIVTENETKLLYQPLYISFCNLILRRYQGRHAVIYLDFGDMKGSTYKKVIKEMGQRIKKAFVQHEYIIAALINQIRGIGSTPTKNHTAAKLTGFMKVMYEKAKYEDLILSLELLSRILYEHFGTKVFILVDNYEGLLLNVLTNTAISESEAPLILAFFSTLMVRTFQTNIYLEKGILTGSFKMLNLLPHLTDITDYKSTQHVMMRLYSVDQEVLMSIFDRLNINFNIRTKVMDWYGGYRWGSQLCYSIYSPQNVMNFLTTGKIGYLERRHAVFDPLFEKILQYRNMRTYLLWLLYSKPILVSQKELRSQQFTINFIKFKEALHNAKNPFDEQSIEPYFCAVGILAIVKLHGGFGSHIRIPNHAVRMEVAEKLMNYYKKNFKISTPALNKAVTNLASFLSNEKTNLQNFVSFLQTIIKKEPLMNELAESKVKEEEIFELFWCLIFNYITFQITLSYDYQIESIEEVQLNKWILFNDYNVTFIQFRLNAPSAEHVLNISKHHATTMPNFTGKSFVKFVGINLQTNGDVQICTESYQGPFVLISDYTTKPPPIFAL